MQLSHGEIETTIGHPLLHHDDDGGSMLCWDGSKKQSSLALFSVLNFVFAGLRGETVHSVRGQAEEDTTYDLSTAYSLEVLIFMLS